MRLTVLNVLLHVLPVLLPLPASLVLLIEFSTVRSVSASLDFISCTTLINQELVSLATQNV